MPKKESKYGRKKLIFSGGVSNIGRAYTDDKTSQADIEDKRAGYNGDGCPSALVNNDLKH